MKILGLDMGDVWIGTALSDELKIIASPYKTIPLDQLDTFLNSIFTEENINTIIIGYPKTMKGTESIQTKKIVDQKNTLEDKFPHKQWILWDERLSSKRAAQLHKNNTKQSRLHNHSIAAAFILESYLNYLSNT